MFSEIGVQVGEVPESISTVKMPHSIEYQTEAYKIFFEEVEEKVNAYIFCRWDGSAFGPDGYPAEEVMREWFRR
ncbi:MAG: hypothetical protein QMD78_05030 [Methanocellales archaeon]|nr:hypothetical protein [Methanocellales archaeon]